MASNEGGADRRHRTARFELAREGLVAVEGLRAGEAGELGRDVRQADRRRAIKFTDFERRQIAAAREDLDSEYQAQTNAPTRPSAHAEPVPFIQQSSDLTHHRKPQGRPMAPHIRRGNAARSKVRAAIEHVFAQQKGPMALCIRTVGIARAKVKIGLANLTYNIRLSNELRI